MPDIPIWPECNLNCVFCSNPVEGFRNTREKYSYREFAKKWDLYLRGKETFLKFNSVDDFAGMTGGEPTIHPDFLKILAHVRKTWPGRGIKLLTNARMFGYESFAQNCFKIAKTPFEIGVPFFGYDAKSYESISRTPGSFSDAAAGLDAMFRFRKPGQRIGVRIVLHKLQTRHLPRMLDFLQVRYPALDLLELLFIEYEGFALENFANLKMSMRECGITLAKLSPELAKLREFRLLHFPLCVLPKQLWPNTWRTLDPIKIVFSLKCRKCKAQEICLGIHKSYAAAMGVREFKPVKTLSGVALSDNVYHPVRRATWNR